MVLRGLVRLDDGVLRQLIKHPSHLIPNLVRRRIIHATFSCLGRVIGLHEKHLLQFAPLNLLLVCVAHALIDQLKLGLFLARDLLFSLLAQPLLQSLLALLLQVFLDNLVDAGRVGGRYDIGPFSCLLGIRPS